MTRERMRRGERQGRWRRIIQGVYGAGNTPPSSLDIARATALATGGVAADRLAAVLLGYDGVARGLRPCVLVPAGTSNQRRGVRRVDVMPAFIEVGQVRCTDGPTTLAALAGLVSDDTWEQALESGFRESLVTRADVDAMAAGTGRAAARVRRVLRVRGGLEVHQRRACSRRSWCNSPAPSPGSLRPSAK